MSRRARNVRKFSIQVSQEEEKFEKRQLQVAHGQLCSQSRYKALLLRKMLIKNSIIQLKMHKAILACPPLERSFIAN